MTAAKTKVWENVRLTEYLSADGTHKQAKPGDLIKDFPKEGPPEWVVNAGHIRPATSEEEST